jgi:hypothetical protein
MGDRLNAPYLRDVVEPTLAPGRRIAVAVPLNRLIVASTAGDFGAPPRAEQYREARTLTTGEAAAHTRSVSSTR